MLVKFFHLPLAYQGLVAVSASLLWMVRLGLWLVPFRNLQRLLTCLAQVCPKRREVNAATIDRVVWAVIVASHCVPQATCLTQALVTRLLLARYGCDAYLRFGVARSDSGQFQAHAWLECQGRVVIGGVDSPTRFTPLPALESKIE